MKQNLKGFISLATLLLISACGGGGNSTPILIDQTVSGQVNAPSGQIAYFQEKSFLSKTVDFFLPSAVADLLGLTPVANAEVTIFRIDANGKQQGNVLATATTDASGNFTVNLSLDFNLDATLIAQVKGQNGKTMRAFILGEQITIDPRSEFLVRKVLSSGIDVSTVSLTDIKSLAETVAAIDVTAAVDIDATIDLLAQGAGDAFDNQVNTLSQDKDRPIIAGAIAKSNTTVLVSFSEPMGPSAADPTNYSIVLENVQTEAGGLSVISATLSDDKTNVLLVTGSQAQNTYRVFAVNVRDLAGNVIAQQEFEIGSTTDPSSATFAGMAPSLVTVTLTASDVEGEIFKGWKDLHKNGIVDIGDALTDSQGNSFLLVEAVNDAGKPSGVIANWQDDDGDGKASAGDTFSGELDSDFDGLPDSAENTGWTVTITKNGVLVSARQVTSDPQNPDTDGDGVTDDAEAHELSDPRRSDTDGDGISDFLEWNVVFSSLTDQDSDGDGVSDMDEYLYKLTDPNDADSDGDGMTDGEELDKKRDPRIADRPSFYIDVKNLKIDFEETYQFTNSDSVGDHKEKNRSITLEKEKSSSFTKTDSASSETAGHIEAQVETGVDYTQTDGVADGIFGFDIPWKFIATVGGGSNWSNTQNFETSQESAQQVTESLGVSISEGEDITKTKEFARSVTGGTIKLTLDVINDGTFALNFDFIEVSALLRQGGKLLPIAKLLYSTPLQINPSADADSKDPRGENLIIESEVISPNLIDEIRKRAGGLVFQVSNYSVSDSLANSFSPGVESALLKTAGIVIDYGDSGNTKRYIVGLGGSNDADNLVGGGWQGGTYANGDLKGVSLDYALQSIVGLTRHYAYDMIVAGPNGALDTPLDENTDDVLVVDAKDSRFPDDPGFPRIEPGPNGWIDTQPVGDDTIRTHMVDRNGNPSNAEQGIIVGTDRRIDLATTAAGKDIRVTPKSAEGAYGLPYGTIIVRGGGEGGALDKNTVAGPGDKIEFIGGYETSRTCKGGLSDGAICKINADCVYNLNQSGDDIPGSCTGPERIARIGSLRSGDFNRDWYITTSEYMPTAADFNSVVLKPGQVFRLAFLQDLDGDHIFARNEALYGSIDSARDIYNNDEFGIHFNTSALSPCKFADPAKPNQCDKRPDSIDSDQDGLSDFFEINIGWKVPNGSDLVQVFSSPASRDGDHDGLQDAEEMDLRTFCKTDGTEMRIDALCAFQLEDPVTRENATAIIAGPNGKLDSVLDARDQYAYGITADSTGLLYGTPVILPQKDPNNPDATPVIYTELAGDDLYINGNEVIPATHPQLRDTDNDGVSDFDEVTGYDTSPSILDGGNGVSDTVVAPTDVALVNYGQEVQPKAVLVLAGEDQEIESDSHLTIGNGDDYYLSFHIACGPNGILDTVVLGQDNAIVNFGEPCAPLSDGQSLGIGPHWVGATYTFDSIPNVTIRNSEVAGDDILFPGKTVVTDPLRPDTDGDFRNDWDEIIAGTDPTNPNDSTDVLDSDGDGLTDYIETKGWYVTINGVGYKVTTDPTVADTDNDGLPDLVEYEAKSMPMTDLAKGYDGEDSDGDGLTDYQEFTNFAKYKGKESQYPNAFDVDFAYQPKPGADGMIRDSDGNILHYGTSLVESDSDGDGLSDKVEVDGWDITDVDGSPVHVDSDPWKTDTDGDTLDDKAEYDGWDVTLLGEAQHHVYPHPRLGDSDGDGLSDAQELANPSGPLDPVKKNTDGDTLDLSDYTELQLGTDPLNQYDRCVEYGFQRAYLETGANGEDGGYLTTVFNAQIFTNSVPIWSSYIYGMSDQRIELHQDYVFPDAARKFEVLDTRSSVKLRAIVKYSGGNVNQGPYTVDNLDEVSLSQLEANLQNNPGEIKKESSFVFEPGTTWLTLYYFTRIYTDPAQATCK